MRRFADLAALVPATRTVNLVTACSSTSCFIATARRPEPGLQLPRRRPLDMRMDTTRGEPVSAWLARAGVDEIRKVIATLGEERFADALRARL